MAGVSTQVPAEILMAVGQAYAELASSGRFNGALKVGERAPEFTLPNMRGELVTLSTLLQEGSVVLSFYRGAWCPFCNIELRALQKALPELRAKGATVVAVSPEQPDYSMPLAKREAIQFEVLSDHANALARQFGIVFPLQGELLRISRDVFGVDLPKFNGDESWELPIPATYLIDREGVIRLAFVDPEFRNRLDPAMILDALDSLGQA